jgi:hypothetical protein
MPIKSCPYAEISYLVDSIPLKQTASEIKDLLRIVERARLCFLCYDSKVDRSSVSGYDPNNA